MIGTGSTGIQVAPVVAETAAHLTVFQRTANYSIPANNMPLTPELKRMFKEKAAEIRETTRSTPNGYPFHVNPRKALEISPEERERMLEEAWQRGGMQFRATFQDVLLEKAANDVAAEFIRRKIAATVKDPKKRAILLDIDHPYGAKRPPIDTGYFECFNRDNVSLVDVKAAPIERITPEGIRTADADYPLDIIIFATGFDAMTGPLLRIDIRGRDGLTLEQAWEAGPKTYLGLQVEGFPNMFTMTGPGSPSVLCVMPVAIEQHAEWIAACIDYMRKHDIATIEPKPDAVDAWVAHVNEAANATLLVQAKHSWYLGANIPGKPRVFMPYAGGMIRYREKCDAVAANGYEGFALGMMS
jgi:cation diffusion facilitator CzcD-associated flavoprotein CzcO